MKFLLVLILSVSIAAGQAALVPTENYEKEINDVINEAKQIEIDTAAELKRQLEDFLDDSSDEEEFEAIFQAIEDRKVVLKDEKCIEALERRLAAITDKFLEESNCGIVAAKTSAEILVDTAKATKQILFGGFDLLKLRRKCKRHKNSTLRKTCYARLSVKATLYLNNTRKSVRVLKESVSVRIPNMIDDAKTCLSEANSGVFLEMESVNSDLDACIEKV